MSRTLEFIMSHSEEGRKLGRVVQSVCGISTTQYSKLKQEQGVTLDGKVAWANEKVKCGQVLRITFPKVAHTPTTQRPAFIKYEDDDLFVIDKPAPLPTMHSRHQETTSLEEIITDYFGSFRPVNRLDKGTSGLMVVAKNPHIQYLLQNQLHTEEFVRQYIACVEGVPPYENGVVRYSIAKKPSASVQRIVDENGKECTTFYQHLSTNSTGNSLLLLQLASGRTHQIRVHMQAIGCPVVGDYLYGTEHPSLPRRFALHSYKACFYQPLTKQVIDIVAQPPPVFYTL